MTASEINETHNQYADNRGALPDAEVDQLEQPALKGLLTNRVTPELRQLVEEFATYGRDGIDTILEYFNDQLAKFWSPYRLRAVPDNGPPTAAAITIEVMFAQNENLRSSGQSFSVRANQFAQA